MRHKLFPLILMSVLCLFLAPAMNAQGSQVTFTYTYSGYPMIIPIDDWDAFVAVGFTVPRNVRISKVTANVQIDYGNVSDLNIFLFSPIGTRAKLLERNCGEKPYFDSTFDDAAPSMYSNACPSSSGGTFRGNEPLSNFNGQLSLGTWRLAVENNGSNSRTGFVTGFSLTISGTLETQPSLAPEGVRNSAAPLMLDQPIAPGEIISVLGTNLGPQNGITTTEPYWPTWIDGTVIRINGVDAPMRFISLYRIDVHVPAGLDLSRPAKIQAFRNGVPTNEIEVPVATTSPAVFTTNRSGLGQAEAYSANGKLNNAGNPTARGSIVTVMATGLGLMDPVMTSGQPLPAGSTAVPVETIGAAIGGADAKVVKAYLANNQVGVWAVEIEVPQNAFLGDTSVVIRAGQRASQAGVTIAVQ